MKYMAHYAWAYNLTAQVDLGDTVGGSARTIKHNLTIQESEHTSYTKGINVFLLYPLSQACNILCYICEGQSLFSCRYATFIVIFCKNANCEISSDCFIRVLTALLQYLNLPQNFYNVECNMYSYNAYSTTIPDMIQTITVKS